MNKILLILVLTASLSVHAGQRGGVVEPDSLVMAVNTETGEREFKSFSEIEEDIEADNPHLFTWCTLKGNFSAGAINDRDEISKEEMITTLSTIRDRIDHYQWVEVQRVVNEYTMTTTNGEWLEEKTGENMDRVASREYSHCLINGF